MDRCVDIILGTFNGERFLAHQLESLENQTVSTWRLIARDDGSSDATRSILGVFKARHPERVQLVDDASGRLGPAGNYGRLLEHSTARYTLFCDQDDVWDPRKIELLIGRAIEEERPDRPLLVHSDLSVVDERLRAIAPSFWRYQRIDPKRCSWPQLLVQNVVTGCAALINASLRRVALPIAPEAIMHDWWLALVAATCGDIRWIETPTVQYRQHGANDTGAKHWGMNQATYFLESLLRPAEYRRGLLRSQRQALALAAHREAPLDPSVRAAMAEFGHLHEQPFHQRLRFVRRHGIAKNGVIRNLVFLRNV